MQNKSGSTVVAQVNGSLTNNASGIIQTNGSSFTLNITGDVTNNSTWSNSTSTINLINKILSLTQPITSSSLTLTTDNTTTVIIGGTSTINIPSSVSALKDLILDNSNGTSLQGNVVIDGKFKLKNGALNLNGKTFSYGTNGTLEYNGTAVQTTSNNEFPATNGPATLVINNAASVNLHASRTLTTNLNFIAGNLNTGTNTITIPYPATVTRTSGHIVGNLHKIYAPGGSFGFLFEIGDTTKYTPIEIYYGNGFGNSGLTVSTTAGDHADIQYSGLVATKSVNRSWKIIEDVGSSGSFSYATFNFNAADVDAGADPNKFEVAVKNGSTWAKATVDLRAATSTRISAIPSYGEFVIGVPTSSLLYVDAGWAGKNLNEDPDGTGPATSFGYDAFATLQDALAVIPAGGTVLVNSGSYTGEVQVAVTGVSIRWSTTGATKPSLTNASGNVFAINANGVKIKGFKVSASSKAIVANGRQTVHLENLEIVNSIIGLELTNCSSFNLINNTINTNTTGIVLSNVSSTTLFNNFINSNTNAIKVEGSFSGLMIQNNNLAGNTGVALLNSSTTELQVHDNWWGSADGPKHSSNTYNVSTQIGSITGPVSFAPWFTDGTDDAMGDPGWQPVVSSTFAPVLLKDADGVINGLFSSIQRGIEATGGSSNNVIVKSGTYTEEVTVNKSMINVLGYEESTTKASKAPRTQTVVDPRPLVINKDPDGPGGPLTALGSGHGLIVWGSKTSVRGFRIQAENIGAIFYSSMSGISQSEITNCNTGLIGQSSNGFMYDNSIHQNGVGILLNYASGYNISQNDINANSTGIVLQNINTSGTVTISENFIHANSTGLTVVNGNTLPVVISFNDLSGNSTAGVQNNSSTALAAYNNWWGGTGGPVHTSNTTNTLSKGNSVSDNVVYSSWLTNGSDGDVETPGFQLMRPMEFRVNASPGGKIDFALSNVFSEDKVTVEPGTYLESLNINTTGIILQGEGAGLTRPMIDSRGPGSANGITIGEGVNQTKLENLRIIAGNSGIQGYYNGNLEINNVDVMSSSNGIHLSNANTVTLTNVVASENENDGIWLSNVNTSELNNVTANKNGGRGIQLNGGQGLTFSTIIANENSTGLQLENINTSSLTGVTANKNHYDGIKVSWGYWLSFTTLVANENTSNGVVLQSSEDVTILGIEAKNNNSTGLLDQGWRTTVVGGILEGNQVGLNLESTDNGLYRGLTITGNKDFGVSLLNSAQHNIVWNNSITSNGSSGNANSNGGVLLGPGDVWGNSISSNSIADNTGHGVLVDNSQNQYDEWGNLNVIGVNNIIGNTLSGITILNESSSGLTAPHNWWGVAAGANQGGSTTSANVDAQFPQSAVLTFNPTQPGPILNSVQPGIVYRTLQEAIDNINTTATTQDIIVKPAALVESENSYIAQEGVRLLGAGKDLSYITFTYPGLTLDANNLTVQGIDFDAGGKLDTVNGTFTWRDYYGVDRAEKGYSTQGTGSNLDLISGYPLIRATYDKTGIIIRDNRVRGVNGAGIILEYSHGTLIENNFIHWNRYAGVVDEGSTTDNQIVRNKIFENGDVGAAGSGTPNAGIVLNYAIGSIVRSNEIFGNVNHGIYVKSEDAVIDSNNIHDNGVLGAGSFNSPAAISAPSMYNTLIKYNTINNAVWGIRLYGSDNQVLGNTIVSGPPIESYGDVEYSAHRAQKAMKSGKIDRTATKNVPTRADAEQEKQTFKTERQRIQSELQQATNTFAARRKATSASKTASSKRTTANAVTLAKSSTRKLRFIKKQSVKPAAAANTANGNYLWTNGIEFGGNNITVGDSNSVSGFHGSGILIDNANSSVLVKNTIQNNSIGVEVDNSNSTLLGKNTISQNKYTGVELYEDNWLTQIWNNTIVNNGASADPAGSGGGILIYPWNNNGNSISANVIDGNTGYGVKVIASEMDESEYTNESQMNIIVLNNITRNTEAGVVLENGSTTNLNAQHNWWGDAAGPDGEANNPAGKQLASGNINTIFAKTAPLSLTSLPAGPVVNIQQNKVYTRLSEAINYASDDDEIQIALGGSVEPYNAYIYQSGLKLLGVGKDLSYIFMPYSTYEFYGNNVTISGLDLDGGGKLDTASGVFEWLGQEYYDQPAKALNATQGLTYERSMITLNYECTGNIIENNRIRGAGGDYGGYGIYLQSPTSTIVRNNDVLWNRNIGILDEGAYTNNVIRDNRVFWNGDVNLLGQSEGFDEIAGIMVMYSEGTQILENEIFENVSNGILAVGLNTQIENNTIRANGRVGEVDQENALALGLFESEGGTVKNNVVTDAVWGIITGWGYDHTIMGNTVTSGAPIMAGGLYRSELNKSNSRSFLSSKQLGGLSSLKISAAATPREKHTAVTENLKNQQKNLRQKNQQHRSTMMAQKNQPVSSNENLTASQVAGVQEKGKSPVPKLIVRKGTPKKGAAVASSPTSEVVETIGLGMFGLERVNVESNTVTGFYGSGIMVESANTTNIIMNTTQNNPVGIKLSNENSTMLAKNTISNNLFRGIELENSYGSVIWNNTITFNGATADPVVSGAGIWITSGGSNYISISANAISGNTGHGVYVENSNTTVMQNVIAMNNIVNNTISGITLLNSNTVETVLNAQHNWWGDAAGPDFEANNPTGKQLASGNIITLFAKSSPLTLASLPVAPVINVMQNTSYRSITEALKAANDNDEIRIALGGFISEYEPYIPQSGIKLTGAGKDLTYLNFPHGGIYVEGSNVLIEKFDLDGNGIFNQETGAWMVPYYYSYDLVDINGGSGSIIRENRIRGGGEAGVYLDNTSNATIENNEIRWNAQAGVYDAASETNNLITQNEIFENGDTEDYFGGPYGGIILAGSSGSKILNNNIHHNVVHGIWAGAEWEVSYATVDAVIEGNTIVCNGWFGIESGFGMPAGISVPWGYNIQIKNNLVGDNAKFGIRIAEGSDNLITGNKIGGTKVTTNPLLTGDPLLSASEARRGERAQSFTQNSVLDRENPQGASKRERKSESREVRARRVQQERSATRPAMKAKLAEQREKKQEQQKAQRLGKHTASVKNSLAQKSIQKSTAVNHAQTARKEKLEASSNMTYESKGNLNDGIVIQDYYNTVENNVYIAGNGGAGIRLEYADGSGILNNLAINENSTGLALYNSNTTAIIGNNISMSSDRGMDLRYSDNIKIYQNEVFENSTGLILQNVSTSNLGQNTIRNNTTDGITLFSPVDLLIGDNTISSNSLNGVRITGTPSGTRVIFNRISNHTSPGFGIKNETLLGVDGRFNWWGNETGPKHSSNPAGVGDAVSDSVVFSPFLGAIPSLSMGQTFAVNADSPLVMFGLTGVGIDFGNTGGGGEVIVTNFNTTPPPGSVTDPDSVLHYAQFFARYWEITRVTPGNDGTFSLTFSYAGVPDTVNPALLRIAYRSSFAASGTGWTLVPVAQTILNTTDKTITATGLTHLSQWTVLARINPVPAIAAVTPTNGIPGTTMNISITGSGFLSGVTTVSIDSNITVNSVTVSSATDLTANITLKPTATLGKKNVLIINPAPGGGSSKLDTAFIVTFPKPTIASLTPVGGTLGQTLSVVLTGTNFYQGFVSSNFGNGITVNYDSVLSTTQLKSNITILNTTTVGVRTVKIRNTATSEVDSLLNAFTLSYPKPALTSLSPASGVRGKTLVVTLTGTNLYPGVIASNFGPEITVVSDSVYTATQLQSAISIKDTAALGLRMVKIRNTVSGEVDSLLNAFTVNNPAPMLTSASLAIVLQDSSFSVTLTGTDFVSKATTVSFGDSIKVDSLLYSSATQMTAKITVAAGAAVGTRNIIVTTPAPGGGSDTLKGVLSVGYQKPVFTKATPDTVGRGQTLSIVVTGKYFIAGATQVTVGAPLVVDSVKVNTATQATVYITVPAAAASGPVSMTITNPSPGGG
ncbi:MAG: right-handed parallel beta-helix repeat-containing protein, partial [bacterium]